MDNIPKVSIIIPCYNVENYIKRCINSVLGQSYKNVQIVLIDDGSTDSTNKIILDTITNKNNVIYIQNENRGVSNARNTGLNVATGDYIMFLDSDDYISKNTIANMLKLMDKYNSDLVRCNIQKEYITENKIEKFKPIYSKVRSISKEKFSNTIYKKILSTETMNSVCFSLFKTNIIKENKLKFREDIHNGEDAIFFMNYINNCKSVVYTPAAYYHYTITNTGLTGTGLSMDKLWDSKLKFIDELKIKENIWKLTKYNYVDKKIIYIVMSCIIRLYKKDKNTDSNYKRNFLKNMIQDVNLLNILSFVEYKKLNFTENRIIILDKIKENDIDGAIGKIELI